MNSSGLKHPVFARLSEFVIVVVKQFLHVSKTDNVGKELGNIAYLPTERMRNSSTGNLDEKVFQESSFVYSHICSTFVVCSLLTMVLFLHHYTTAEKDG
jgi:hypothetical protein